jgi:hypothetical protein
MIVSAIDLASAEALTPDQVAVVYPALTVNYLQKLRNKGGGPVYSKPTDKRVIYRRADIEAWLDASRVSSTSEGR